MTVLAVLVCTLPSFCLSYEIQRNDLRWHVCRVIFARKILFGATNFLTKNAPKFSPKFLSLHSAGQKKSRKIPAKFPTKFPCKKSKKITDELLQEARASNEATVAVLTGLAVSSAMAVSVMTATPLKLNPPFRDPDTIGQKLKGTFWSRVVSQGVRVPIGVLGGEVWGRVQVGGGGWIACGK